MVAGLTFPVVISTLPHHSQRPNPITTLLTFTHPSAIIDNKPLVFWHLQRGADPNLPSSRGLTPLVYAAQSSTLPIIKLLITDGANVHNTIALHAAAESDEADHSGRLEIMKFLLDQGAGVNLMEPKFDSSRRRQLDSMFRGTALHRAVKSKDPERVKLPLRRGVNRHMKGVEGSTPPEVAEARELKEITDLLRAE